VTSTSATAAAKLAATSAVGTSRPSSTHASIQRATAVLSPLNEKSYGYLVKSLGAVSPRGKVIARGSPPCARRSTWGPPEGLAHFVHPSGDVVDEKE